MPPFDYRRRATRNAYGYWVVGRSKSDAAATSEAAAARLAARTKLGAAAGSSSSSSNSSGASSSSISASSSSISPAAKKALEDFYAPWQHKSAAAHCYTPPHTAHRTPHTAHRTPHTAHCTPHGIPGTEAEGGGATECAAYGHTVIDN